MPARGPSLEDLARRGQPGHHGVPQWLRIASERVVALPVNRHLIMVFIALLYLLGGSFQDDLAFLILATPIFFPAAVKNITKVPFAVIYRGVVPFLAGLLMK